MGKDLSNFDMQEIVEKLQQAREQWRISQQRTKEPLRRELPSIEAMENIIDTLKAALFPMRLGSVDFKHEKEDVYVTNKLNAAFQALLQQAYLELTFKARLIQHDEKQLAEQAEQAIKELFVSLPEIRGLLDSDVIAAFHGDPAAQSVDEVLLCYPGILAMIHHRIAHKLYQSGLNLLARITSELAHSKTGIDIHPGAKIGSGFFIDHGTGVVIGETVIIGHNVRIYQAVTLGAKRFQVDESGHLVKNTPRHPIVEDDVVIYAGATILGRITLGKGAVIGGNVWVTEDVAKGTHVSQASLLKDKI